jgi:hypothetical protein
MIERKADTRCPLRKRVRKSLKAKGLNESEGKDSGTRGRSLGSKSALEIGKHGKE